MQPHLVQEPSAQKLIHRVAARALGAAPCPRARLTQAGRALTFPLHCVELQEAICHKTIPATTGGVYFDGPALDLQSGITPVAQPVSEATSHSECPLRYCRLRAGNMRRSCKPELDDGWPSPMASSEPRFKTQYRHDLVHRSSVACTRSLYGLTELLLTDVAQIA